MRMEPINGIYYVMVDRVLITGVIWSSISLGMIILMGWKWCHVEHTLSDCMMNIVYQD